MGTLSNFPFWRGSGGHHEPSAIDVRPATDAEIDPAIRLLLRTSGGPADEAHVRHFLQLARDHRNDAGGIRIALQAGRPLTATFPVVSPGHTMLLFLPNRIADEAEEQAVHTLIEQTCTAAAAEQVQLCQVLIELTEPRLTQILETRGFRRLAELLYMQVSIPRSPKPAPLPTGCRWVRYSPSTHDLFARTILATYQESLDCPGLNGLREVDDIIAGHKATGHFEPDHWCVLAHGDEPMAVLLLSSIYHTDMMELVYLGLVPSARGKGIGDLLLRHAIATAAASRHTRLSLAVDAANLPALKLYWRHGLQTLGRKLAMLRNLRAVSVTLGPGIETPAAPIHAPFNGTRIPEP